MKPPCNSKTLHREKPESHRVSQRNKKIQKMELKYQELTHKIIGCAMEVHKLLGPGLLKSAYEECLVYELIKAGLFIERQKEFR